MFKYLAAYSWLGTGYRNAILKSSFQPMMVSSVPLNAMYMVPSSRKNVMAENWVSHSGSTMLM